MTYQKPYTFRAGTYAKAAEVNANFDTIKDFVDDLQDAIGNVEVSKTPYNKANLQGNPNVTFYCNTSTEANAAVNNTQLTNSLVDINNTVSTNTEDIAANSEAIEDLQQAIGEISLAPSYTNYTVLPASTGTIPNGGLLYLTNGDSVNHTITLGTFNFIIRANSNVTFPVRQGTAYDLTSFSGGNVSKILFTL